MTDLPFIFLDAVFHVGAPLAVGHRFVPRGIKNWDFEFGLLSVSLDPDAWRHAWAGVSAVIYEITTDRQLCFIDADATLANARHALEHAAVTQGLAAVTATGFVATPLLYACLRLTPGSLTPLTGRADSDQILQAALTALVSFAGADSCVDGLWWSDDLDGTMRTERGGIFQHKLSTFQVSTVSAPAPVISPVAVWQGSSII